MTPYFKESQREYSYRDYLQSPNEERWELIDGTPYLMSPAPPRIHEEITVQLTTEFSLFLRNKTCRVYTAPFDVRLPSGDEPDEEIKTVVQPDIVVVCDRSKLDDKGCKGAPDLIVEIISEYSAKRDKKEKFQLYERVGVKEYWIIHPEERMVEVYQLENGDHYGRPEVYSGDDQIKVGILPGLTIDLKMVFGNL